jgi:lipopolysaccharide/colanic/teichoic acid biosynthesis glycosyltransferase
MKDPNYLLDRSLNLVGASLLLILTSPLFAILPLLIKTDDPRSPVLYRGERLGRHKKAFTILKFRTLKPEATKVLAGDLVSQAHNAETKIGSFLRDTRLDELPQLINVLRGEMNLVGPRPERREVYENACKSIRGYERRFTVRPGMIGYSQVFTPHRTYKRFRSLVDYQFSIKNHSLKKDVHLLFAALWILIRRVVRRVARFGDSRTESNLIARVKGKDYKVIDCTEFVVIVQSGPIEICPQFEELDISILSGKKTIHFDGVCLRSSLGYQVDEHDGSKRQRRTTVFLIERLTPLNEYRLHKYALHTSIS